MTVCNAIIVYLIAVWVRNNRVETFQNPRLPLFRQKRQPWARPNALGGLPESQIAIFSKRKQPWARPNALGGLPESQNWLPESEVAIFSEKKAALRTPQCSRRASKNRKCHFSISYVNSLQYLMSITVYLITVWVRNNRVQCNNRVPNNRVGTQ